MPSIAKEKLALHRGLFKFKITTKSKDKENDEEEISEDNLLLVSYFYPFNDIFPPEEKFIAELISEDKKTKKKSHNKK